ncbi:AraC family transcriptional regulator, partial [Vibrio vulnificus]
LQYITALRMEKAKALLTHTDLPVQRVAEQVGYSDLSAFSRRFSRHFGLSPRAFCRA